MVQKAKYIACFLLFATLIACYDKDITNIENTLIYTPEYSVPIGSDGFLMADVVSSSTFDTIPADSANWNDTLIFEYNDRYYYLPEDATWDTVFYEYFNFAESQEWLDQVTELMFRLNFRNGITGNVLTQVHFLDANQQELFQLFDDSGLFIPTANAETPTIHQEDVYLTEEELEMLPQVRFFQAHFRLYIQNIAEGVRYFPYQEFNMQMGIRAALEIDLNEQSN